MKQPKFYTLPPSQSVLLHLTDLLLEQNQKDPFLLSVMQIILPTRRSVRKLKQLLLDNSPSSTLLLPKIHAINDLAPPFGSDFQPEMPATLRLGLMLKLLKAQKDIVPSLEMAQQLCTFIDQIHIEEANLSKLGMIIPDQFAHHWQLTLGFLNMLHQKWPQIVKQHGYAEPYIYRRQVWDSTISQWQNEPPSHPIIAAGITGDIPAVGRLLKCIAALPNGQVILPNVDLSLSADEWQTLKPSHPQYTHQRFFEREGIEFDAIQMFSDVKSRDQTITAMMKSDLSQDKVSISGMQCMEFETAHTEAEHVALIIREQLAKAEQTIAVVSSDRKFNKRLRAELQRWKIDIDDSAGISLSETALGQLILQSAELPDFEHDPTRTIALLKHPFITLGYTRPELLKLVRTLEAQVLRAPKNLKDLSSTLIERIVKRGQNNLIEFVNHWKRKTNSFLNKNAIPLKALLESHFSLLETLSTKDILWNNDAGQALVPQFQALMNHAEHMGQLTTQEYAHFLKIFLNSMTVHEPFSHPRVQLLGAIEARLLNADLVILTNMNEGSWPTASAPNPWLNRSMQNAIGLPDPDVQLGKEALDFTLALGHKQVILTRAMRNDGTLTNPSRWLLRLKTLAARHQANIALPTDLHAWHQLLDQPIYDIKINEPEPSPPVSTRPLTLTISDIDLLIKDAYAFYAKNILKLAPLDQMEVALTPALFGIWLHRILQHHPNAESLAQYQLEKNIDPIWAYQFESVKAWLLSRPEFNTIPDQLFTEEKFINCLHNLEIIGKADRIEVNPEGASIIDYKTGTLPTQQEIKTGLAPQLPLLAMLSKMKIHHLAYWDLKNQEIRKLDDSDAIIAFYDQILVTLFENYVKEDFTFKSSAITKSPYQHLKRAQEWLNNCN
jgi:ATP-dependent helicase/nuclease subunit B